MAVGDFRVLCGRWLNGRQPPGQEGRDVPPLIYVSRPITSGARVSDSASINWPGSASVRIPYNLLLCFPEASPMCQSATLGLCMTFMLM